MKAICVTDLRTLEVREISTPSSPSPGHVLVLMDSATITHGDKFFLTHPLPDGAMAGGRHDVYGSNGGGTVIAIGDGVPVRYADRKVGVYKSLVRSADAVGMWCAVAHVPYQSCLLLPDHVRIRDYNGSFANVLTVHAFLTEALTAGHQGIIVTAGSFATGLIAASLARRRGVPALLLVRSQASRDFLLQHGIEHVLLTTEDDFDVRLTSLAAQLGTTAVFDGVGGALLGRLLPGLPANTTIYIYGFLDAGTPTAFSSMSVVARNFTIRRFANLESPIVTDPDLLANASAYIESIIDDPLLETRIGREFGFEEIDEAMAYQDSGARAVLIP